MVYLIYHIDIMNTLYVLKINVYECCMSLGQVQPELYNDENVFEEQCGHSSI